MAALMRFIAIGPIFRSVTLFNFHVNCAPGPDPLPHPEECDRHPQVSHSSAHPGESPGSSTSWEWLQICLTLCLVASSTMVTVTVSAGV